ncbi:protein HID1 isoform X3 [Gasterosteus aculeatus]
MREIILLVSTHRATGGRCSTRNGERRHQTPLQEGGDSTHDQDAAVLSLTSCRWRSVRFGPPCSVTCALVDPYSHIRPVCPPAARRTLRRCLLGSVLGRHLHHRPGRLRSGAGRRDQSRQGGVSIQPGNPLLQGRGAPGSGCRLRLPVGQRAAGGPELQPPAHARPALHLRGRRLERLLLVHGAGGRGLRGLGCRGHRIHRQLRVHLGGRRRLRSVASSQLRARPQQDGAAEVAAHLSVRGHVPPSVLGEAEPQSLGVLLLLLREQVTPTRAPQVIASRPQSSPLLSPLALPDTPCRCSPPCSTWCAPTTPSDTASRTTTYCSPTSGSSWWSRRCRSSSSAWSTRAGRPPVPPCGRWTPAVPPPAARSRRIHREEDLSFILKGLARLMNNPLVQTYLPHSAKKIQFHQELLILFWKFCDYNKKFLFFVLKSSDVLDVLVPILFSLNDARADQSRVGLMHIGVFILLLLSGERNFGVRLNKPYALRVPMDIAVFTGTHADLLVLIFHKIITGGHQRLQPLFDCLLTIIVNISPYLKSLSMLAANKLLHLLEAFSTPWFLFSSPQNHHLVFFLLEVFNNIIQYQFDGNCNLVYAIIRKRNVFHQLANLPSDGASIQRALQRKKKPGVSRSNSAEAESTDESTPAVPAGPGSLKASLEATPEIDKITEKSQVSLDGTMITVAEPDSAQPPAAGESILEGDGEVCPTQSARSRLSSVSSSATWSASTDWVSSWKSKLPLQTIMRLLQVLVPQVEKICIDKGLTDESEILKFLQHGTLVGLLPVPHPILIRKYQANAGTAMWFRTYMWGVIYLRNVDPPIWYDTDIRLFEIQRI